MKNLYQELENMCEVIENEISSANSKIEKTGGKLTGDDISYIDKLTHIMKSIKSTMAMMDEEEGYSNRGYSNRGYSRVYNDGNGYSARYSRARGRTNARRDSMGRYSRNGYSMENEPIMAELREMMNDTQDERIRQKIQNLIHEMETM